MFFKNKELEAENARLKKELAAFLTVQDELREEMLHIALNPQGQITDINDAPTTHLTLTPLNTEKIIEHWRDITKHREVRDDN